MAESLPYGSHPAEMLSFRGTPVGDSGLSSFAEHGWGSRAPEASVEYLAERRGVLPYADNFDYADSAMKLCVPGYHMLTGNLPPLQPELAEALATGISLPPPPPGGPCAPELVAASKYWGGTAVLDGWVDLVAPLERSRGDPTATLQWHPASRTLVAKPPKAGKAVSSVRSSPQHGRLSSIRSRGSRQRSSFSSVDAASMGLDDIDDADPLIAALPTMSPRTGPSFMGATGTTPSAFLPGTPKGGSRLTSHGSAGPSGMRSHSPGVIGLSSPPDLPRDDMSDAGSDSGAAMTDQVTGINDGLLPTTAGSSSRALRRGGNQSGRSLGGQSAMSTGGETAMLDAAEDAARRAERVICGQLQFRGQTRVSRRFWVSRFVVVDEVDRTLARYKDEQDYEWREGARGKGRGAGASNMALAAMMGEGSIAPNTTATTAGATATSTTAAGGAGTSGSSQSSSSMGPAARLSLQQFAALAGPDDDPRSLFLQPLAVVDAPHDTDGDTEGVTPLLPLVMRAMEAGERDEWLRVFVHAGCAQQEALGPGGAMAARGALGYGPAAPVPAPPPVAASLVVEEATHASHSSDTMPASKLPASVPPLVATVPPEEAHTAPDPVAGYLEKRGERNLLGLRKWRRRFCVLQDGSLTYFHSEDAWRAGRNPRRGRKLIMADFLATSVVPDRLRGLARSAVSHPGYFCLIPRADKAGSSLETRRVWEFRTDDSGTRAEWVSALTGHGAMGTSTLPLDDGMVGSPLAVAGRMAPEVRPPQPTGALSIVGSATSANSSGGGSMDSPIASAAAASAASSSSSSSSSSSRSAGAVSPTALPMTSRLSPQTAALTQNGALSPSSASPTTQDHPSSMAPPPPAPRRPTPPATATGLETQGVIDSSRNPSIPPPPPPPPPPPQ